MMTYQTMQTHLLMQTINAPTTPGNGFTSRGVENSQASDEDTPLTVCCDNSQTFPRQIKKETTNSLIFYFSNFPF